MQRYDALLEEDPEGGWVQYQEVQDLIDDHEEVQDLIGEHEAFCNIMYSRDSELREKLTNEQTVSERLRTSLSSTCDSLERRVRMNSSLFEDLERQIEQTDKLGRRLNSTYMLLAISTLANISWLAYFFIETIGVYIGAFN